MMALTNAIGWPLRVLLLLAGLAGAIHIGREDPGQWRWWGLLPLLAIAAIPPVARRIAAALDRMRQPGDRATWYTTIAVGVVSCCYFFITAVGGERDLAPRFHDEFMHLLQMRMMATGQLWMQPHPLADFFESFHIFVRPVYASMYFPGGSLFYLPAALLNLDHWLLPLLTCSVVVAFTYRLVRAAVDGVAGLLAAVWMLALPQLHMLAFMVMSHQVMLLLGLLAISAWLRWRREMAYRWAVAIGALGGWAAITRPVDALCYMLPIGAAMLVGLVRRSGPQPRRKLARIAVTAGLLILAAAPFLSLQLVLNHGLTGSWRTMPWDEYVRINQPGFAYGQGAFDPTVRPITTLPQKLDYYEKFVVPAIGARAKQGAVETWWNDRLAIVRKAAVPSPLLLVFMGVGLLGPWTVPRAVLLAPLPLFVLFYSPYAHMLDHYGVIMAPPLALLATMGMQQLAAPPPRYRAALVSASSVAVAGALVLALPQARSTPAYELAVWPTMSYVHHDLPRAVEAPAIILFKYTSGRATPHEEPVYNVTTAWPDDAAIIRAHDLGDRNGELFAYYAARQPDRNVYRFDRAAGELTFLGRARDLAPASGSPLH
jgi:4-amino-4-deoxy-L-arabinose transferase-like glycosyltransferase